MITVNSATVSLASASAEMPNLISPGTVNGLMQINMEVLPGSWIKVYALEGVTLSDTNVDAMIDAAHDAAGVSNSSDPAQRTAFRNQYTLDGSNVVQSFT